MNTHPDVEMAVHYDTERLRNREGRLGHGICYGLLFTALLAALGYCAWVALQ